MTNAIFSITEKTYSIISSKILIPIIAIKLIKFNIMKFTY